MRNWILSRTWALFLVALLWGCWLLFVGAVPHLVSGTSLKSLSFEYRDYLIRAFVVFLAAHLFVKRTNFVLLAAIPMVTLVLQVGINVYDFSEWYSRTFRVNLHELNAQLFVVPVQLAILGAGIYFCCRKKHRTTTRLFATIMMAGSIVSTLGFHLSIVNVSYKPVERIYADHLMRLAALDDPAQTCEVMGFDCRFVSISDLEWEEEHLLDPQLPLAHKAIFGEVMATHSWVRRGDGLDHWLGLANAKDRQIQLAEARLPHDWLSPVMETAFGQADCDAYSNVYCIEFGHASDFTPLSAYSQSILETLNESDDYLHAWVHTADVDGCGFVEPALFAAGRREGGEPRIVAARLPVETLDAVSGALNGGKCDQMVCAEIARASDLRPGYPSALIALLEHASAGVYATPAKLWVDKALSRNPVLYINRPEYLRVYAIKDGVIRVFTSPKAFSDITLDMKLTFNLIIGLFSVSWLTLGVFLILFHTRRQLVTRSL